jgi:hypothetical protein
VTAGQLGVGIATPSMARAGREAGILRAMLTRGAFRFSRRRWRLRFVGLAAVVAAASVAAEAGASGVYGVASLRVSGGLSLRLVLDPAGGVDCNYGQLSMEVWAGRGQVYSVGANLVGRAGTSHGRHVWTISSKGQSNGYLREGSSRTWTTVRAPKSSMVVAARNWTSGTVDLVLAPVSPARGALHVTGSFACAKGQSLKAG